MDRSTCRWIPFKNSPPRRENNNKSCQESCLSKGRWMGGCFIVGLFGVSVIIAWSFLRVCVCVCVLWTDHNIPIIIGNSIICKVSFWQLNVDILGACNYYFGYLDSLSSFCCSVVIPLQLLACCQSKFDCVTWWLRADWLFFFFFFFFCVPPPPPPPPLLLKFHVFFVTKLVNFNN
jgi:hypothetical protein